MKKLMFLLMLLFLSSCAYQRYQARSFKPDKKQNYLNKCRTFADVDGHSKKYYYKLK